jgi:ATP-dependent DNA helicase RecG
MSSSVSRSQSRSETPGPLSSGIRALPGVGSKREDLLRGLGIATVGDLLVFPPRRYIDRSTFSAIEDLRNGAEQTVVATVLRSETRLVKRRRLFIVHLEDDTGRMRCVWFNQGYLSNVFRSGSSFVFSGKSRVDRFGRSMVHPEYEEVDSDLLHTGRIVPVYPKRPGIGQKQLRALTRYALDHYLEHVSDSLPGSMREEMGLAPLSYALENLHFPAHGSQAEVARTRLAFDEVLVFQTLFALSRLAQSESESTPGLTHEAVKKFTGDLPFKLTRSQAEALRIILDDIGSQHPMRRLLQGDVGCGKTVVAALAAAVVCDGGGQVALMCPTELLAEQHFATFRQFMKPLGFETCLITGSTAAEERIRIENELGSGAVNIVVGTHTLIGDRAGFKNLRLIIVDEEQRFGVMQRTALLKKAPRADALVVSATPIPRTLALTAYGDLDVTTIGEMPPGRGSHVSRCVSEPRRERLLEAIGSRVEKGIKGFYVCPSVDKSDAGLMDVGTASRKVRKHLPAGKRVAVLTGRTPREERLRLLEDFRADKIAVLVATTVIEVGMDIPTATLLVVDQADRFGLSQLHQMRGRVARGSADSSSFFIVSEGATEKAVERVKVLEASFDGFEIAEKDLVLRGPGDIVGTRQHGIPDLRFARLPEDTDMMLKARDMAFSRVLGKDASSEWRVWVEAVRSLAAGKTVII